MNKICQLVNKTSILEGCVLFVLLYVKLELSNQIILHSIWLAQFQQEGKGKIGSRIVWKILKEKDRTGLKERRKRAEQFIDCVQEITKKKVSIREAKKVVFQKKGKVKMKESYNF